MSRTTAINYERSLSVSEVRLTPEVMLASIESLPSGAIIIDDERAAMLNGFPEVLSAPNFTS